MRLGSCSTSSPRARRSRRSAFDSRAPCQASGDVALVLDDELAVRQLAAVLLGHAERVEPVGVVLRARRPAPAPPAPTARRVPSRRSSSAPRAAPAPPRRGRRGAPSAGAWPRAPPRASAPAGRPAARPRGTCRSRRRAQSASFSQRLAVGVAGPRVARVRRRDLHERRHALGVLERERHRGRGAHGAARPAPPARARARRARPRGRPRGPSTRSSARRSDSPCPRAS